MFFDKYSDLCKKKKKTPTGVALELNVSRSTVNYWKNGNVPKQETLIKIANYFNVSTDYLLGQSDKKTEAAHNELPLSQEQQELLDAISDLSDDDLKKAIEYVELLKLKRNS